MLYPADITVIDCANNRNNCHESGATKDNIKSEKQANAPDYFFHFFLHYFVDHFVELPASLEQTDSEMENGVGGITIKLVCSHINNY